MNIMPRSAACIRDFRCRGRGCADRGDSCLRAGWQFDVQGTAPAGSQVVATQVDTGSVRRDHGRFGRPLRDARLQPGTYQVTAGGKAQDVTVPVASSRSSISSLRRPRANGKRSSSPPAPDGRHQVVVGQPIGRRCTTLPRCRRLPVTSSNSRTPSRECSSASTEPQHHAARRRPGQFRGQRVHRWRQPEGLRRQRRRHRAAAARASSAAAARGQWRSGQPVPAARDLRI